MKTGPGFHRSAARVTLVTASVLLLPLVAMAFTDEVNWSPFDFAAAAAILGFSGLVLELAARKPRNVAPRVVAAAVGVGSIVLGEADDAPGLMLFGGLLILATLALTIRAPRHSA